MIVVLLNIMIGFASYYVLEIPINRFIKLKTNRAAINNAAPTA